MKAIPKLPDRFLDKGFNLAASVSFHIDETGSCIFDKSVFENRVRVTDDELTLYNALVEEIKKQTDNGNQQHINGTPTKQYFNGIFTLREGKPKFRLLSNNWVLR